MTYLDQNLKNKSANSGSYKGVKKNMVNKLIGDLAKCAQLSGHGDVLSHREIDTTLVNDRDGHKRMIIIDKAVDMAPEQAANAINKIYDTFYAKSNVTFWDRMINMFEFQNQVDWYLMLSYLYMVNEDRDNSTRSLVTVADSCAVLAQMDADTIEKSPEFVAYMNMINKQTKSGLDPVKEDIRINL